MMFDARSFVTVTFGANLEARPDAASDLDLIPQATEPQRGQAECA